MPTADFSPYERLTNLLRSNEGQLIRNYDQEMNAHDASETLLILTSSSSRMKDVGLLLTTTDREFRRAATIYQRGPWREIIHAGRDLGEPGNRPRPMSPNYGGLELVDAVPGSFHMLVAAYGQVLLLLTSTPLQALTTVVTLTQSAGSIRAWMKQKKDVLNGINGRQVIEVIKSLGGDPSLLMQTRQPKFELEIDSTPTESDSFDLPEMNQISDSPYHPMAIGGEVSQFGEIMTKGYRITYIRKYVDGTQDIIYFDG